MAARESGRRRDAPDRSRAGRSACTTAGARRRFRLERGAGPGLPRRRCVGCAAGTGVVLRSIRPRRVAALSHRIIGTGTSDLIALSRAAARDGRTASSDNRHVSSVLIVESQAESVLVMARQAESVLVRKWQAESVLVTESRDARGRRAGKSREACHGEQGSAGEAALPSCPLVSRTCGTSARGPARASDGARARSRRAPPRPCSTPQGLHTAALRCRGRPALPADSPRLSRCRGS